MAYWEWEREECSHCNSRQISLSVTQFILSSFVEPHLAGGGGGGSGLVVVRVESTLVRPGPDRGQRRPVSLPEGLQSVFLLQLATSASPPPPPPPCSPPCPPYQGQGWLQSYLTYLTLSTYMLCDQWNSGKMDRFNLIYFPPRISDNLKPRNSIGNTDKIYHCRDI